MERSRTPDILECCGYLLFNVGIWGSIGPARFFGSETPYFSLLLGFPIGFVLPFLPWLANRFYPSQYWQLINVPLLTSFGNNVGAIQAVIIPVAIIGFTTQFYMKRNHTKWFDKYNFLLSIALDSGMAISVLVLTVYQSLAEDASTLSVSTLRPASVPDFYCQEYTFDQS